MCPWNPCTPEHLALVSAPFCQWPSYQSFCRENSAGSQHAGLYAVETEVTGLPELMKDVEITLQRIYWIRIKISEPKVTSGLAPGLFIHAHLGLLTFLKVKGNKISNPCQHGCSHLLLLFIYGPLLSFNRWFEQRVITKSKCSFLPSFSFFSIPF